MTEKIFDKQPTLSRALFCLLLNVVFLPGAGTLAGGEAKRRQAGWIQLTLGLILLPLFVIAALGGAYFMDIDMEKAKSWLANLMLGLVVWNFLSGLGMVRDAWKRSKVPLNKETSSLPRPGQN